MNETWVNNEQCCFDLELHWKIKQYLLINASDFNLRPLIEEIVD